MLAIQGGSKEVRAKWSRTYCRLPERQWLLRTEWVRLKHLPRRTQC